MSGGDADSTGKEAAGREPVRRGRVLIVSESADEAPSEPTPQDAPAPPEPGAEIDRVAAAPARRSSVWLRIFLWAGGLLFAVGLAASVERLIAQLMSASPWLAWSAAALAALAALALLILIIRELAALGRIRRIETLRRDAEDAALAEDARAAAEVTQAIERLYAGRRDVAWEWAALKERSREIVDARTRLAHYEREVIGALDDRARAEVRIAARRVAAATALMPSALLDAAAALYVNLSMIRRLAEIYGGRSGLAGSVALARRVVVHAMAAGLIALGDDLLEPLIGGGVASRVSRRLGEGVVNGALTARIGIAAMEVCRPLPFAALPKPKLRDVAWDAVRPARS